MKKPFLSCLALVLLSLIFHNVYADVGYTPGQKKDSIITPPVILIQGAISSKDVQDLKQILPIARTNARRVFSDYSKAFPNGIITIELNSLGGDVFAALNIGTIAREENLRAVIKDNDSCASSCVFILAGAPYRYVSGKVGIHRPYFPNDLATTSTSQRSQYKKIEHSVISYLEVMNIDSDLYKRMIRIPSEKILWLNDDELNAYGLATDDPYFNEADKTKSASAIGINKIQYLKWLSAIKNICKSDSDSECLFEQLSKIKSSK
jgi:hypothetical protein